MSISRYACSLIGEEGEQSHLQSRAGVTEEAPEDNGERERTDKDRDTSESKEKEREREGEME